MDGGFDELERFFLRGRQRGKGHAVPEFRQGGKGRDDSGWGGAFYGVHFKQSRAGDARGGREVGGFGEKLRCGAGGGWDVIAILQILTQDDGDAVPDFWRWQGGEAAVELASAAADTALVTEMSQHVGQELHAEPELARYLRDELAASRKELAALQLQLSQLEQAKQELAAVEAQLAPIAREAIQRLQVALRQKPTTLAGLPASVLAAQYAEVKTEFERVMPVGAKALSGSDTSREPVDAGEQRLFLVR